MRILHYVGTARIPRDPDADAASGVTRVALELARVQAAHGDDVTVAAANVPAWRAMWRNVRLVSLGEWAWARATVRGNRFDLRGHLPLVKETLACSYDVVHCHNYGFLRFIRAEQKIMHFHSDPLFQDERFTMRAWQEKDFGVIRRHASKIIAVSSFVADRAREGIGRDVNVAVVPNGVNSNLYCPPAHVRQATRKRWGVPDDGAVFLYCGAIDPVKGLLNLAAAFERVATANPHAYLVIAGTSGLWGGTAEDDEYQLNLHRKLMPLTDQGRAIFLGLVGYDAMPQVYQAADVVVVPSIWTEASPMVVLEAQASARPVIASRTGGIPELVSTSNGLMVSPEAEDDLVRAMTTLGDNPVIRRALGCNGRAAAQLRTWNRSAEAVKAVYTDLTQVQGKDNAVQVHS
jgi:glycosyltransferase involved in cell wall biosynthesis